MSCYSLQLDHFTVTAASIYYTVQFFMKVQHLHCCHFLLLLSCCCVLSWYTLCCFSLTLAISVLVALFALAFSYIIIWAVQLHLGNLNTRDHITDYILYCTVFVTHELHTCITYLLHMCQSPIPVSPCNIIVHTSTSITRLLDKDIKPSIAHWGQIMIHSYIAALQAIALWHFLH